MISFKGRHFMKDIIMMAVRWYLAYALSYRDIEELMQERGFSVDHSTINRWVTHYAPLLEEEFRKNNKRKVGVSWRMDETYILIKEKRTCYYRTVDKEGNTIFDCTKLFRTEHLNLIRKRLQAIREVLGENGDIIFECHSLPGVASALQLGQIAEEFNCFYFEEPVNYLNSKLHRPLREKLKIPLAAGERLYLRHGIREYLEDQTVDILQPDIGLCGGLTEAKKICDYADMYDVQIQAHVCGGPVATMVALHLETAIPNFLIHEHHTYAIKSWNRELCLQDPQPVNGYFTVSEAPGLGIELNDEVVKRSPHIEIKK